MIPIILAFITAICYGISKVLIKKAGQVNPFIGVLSTLSVGLPILLFFAGVNGELFFYELNPWTTAVLLLYTLCFLVVGRIFAYASINLVGAARASQLTSTQVIFAAVLSIVFLKENMNMPLGVATVIIFLGVLLISFSNPQNLGNEVIPKQTFRKGLGLGLSAGLLWGIAQPLAKESVRALGSSTRASLFAYIFAIIALGVFMICFERENIRLTMTQAKYLLPSGIVFTIGVVVQYLALSSSPVVLINPIVNVSPLITLIATYLFLQKIEVVNRKVIIGAIAIVFGVILVTISM